MTPHNKVVSWYLTISKHSTKVSYLLATTVSVLTIHSLQKVELTGRVEIPKIGNNWDHLHIGEENRSSLLHWEKKV